MKIQNMTKLNKVTSILLFLVILIIFIPTSLITLTQFSKSGICYKSGKKLTESELIFEVIKNYINNSFEVDAKLHDSPTMRQNIFFLNKRIDKNEVMKITDKYKLLNVLKTSIMTIENKDEIDKMYNFKANIASGDFTIFIRSNQYIMIITMDNFKKVDSDKIKEFSLNTENFFKKDFLYSYLGYGNNFYSIVPYNLSEKILENNEAKFIFKYYEGYYQNFYIISNCGDFLY